MRGRGGRDGARSSRRVYVTVGLGCRATRDRTRGMACARQGGRGSESKALWLELLEGRRRSKVEGEEGEKGEKEETIGRGGRREKVGDPYNSTANQKRMRKINEEDAK